MVVPKEEFHENFMRIVIPRTKSVTIDPVERPAIPDHQLFFHHFCKKKIFFGRKKSFLHKKIFFGRKHLWPKKVLAENRLDFT